MDNKNFDVRAVSEIVARYKNAILNVVVILVALLVSFKIYQAQQTKVESLIRKKSAELQKNDMLKQISASEKKFNEFKNYLNKKQVSSIIGTLGAMAADSSVEITSIKPGAQEALPVYAKYPFSLNLRANDYHTLGRFIARIESNADVYIIKSLTIRPDASVVENAKPKVDATLELYTIFVKK